MNINCFFDSSLSILQCVTVTIFVILTRLFLLCMACEGDINSIVVANIIVR